MREPKFVTDFRLARFLHISMHDLPRVPRRVVGQARSILEARGRMREAKRVDRRRNTRS